MDQNDRQAIEDLFDRLEEAERRSPPRDPEAEALIRSAIQRQPASPYYMAQTVVVQQQALETARRRIEELEGRRLAPHEPDRAAGRDAGPWSRSPGFLAGAAQTAMGVAGGVLLGNLIAGALFGGPAGAEAADSGNDAEEASAGADSDFGGDFDGGFDV